MGTVEVSMLRMQPMMVTCSERDRGMRMLGADIRMRTVKFERENFWARRGRVKATRGRRTIVPNKPGSKWNASTPLESNLRTASRQKFSDASTQTLK
jgi:hypothetical protein